MTDDRWPRIKALFQAALDVPPAERERFLANATADDHALRSEVESLLAADAADAGSRDRLPIAAQALVADSQILTRSFASTLFAKSRIGPYEVMALIGAGAMGEVYRARDTKLNREVALKVLPQPFAIDPD